MTAYERRREIRQALHRQSIGVKGLRADLIRLFIKVDEMSENYSWHESKRVYGIRIGENGHVFVETGETSNDLTQSGLIVFGVDIVRVINSAMNEFNTGNPKVYNEDGNAHVPEKNNKHSYGKDENMKAKVTFGNNKPRYVKRLISEIPAGSYFVNGYHDPNHIMDGSDKASLYVKLPKSERTVGDLLSAATNSFSKTQDNADAITGGRIGFNLTFGNTKALGRQEMGYVVDASTAVEFIKS